MKTSSTYNDQYINFNFNTTYLGDEITLNVISDTGRYSVLHNEKIIGYIKIGDERHIWYVVDSRYTPAYLVNEIGNKIEAQLHN